MYPLLVSAVFPDLLSDPWFGLGLLPRYSPQPCYGQATYGCLMEIWGNFQRYKCQRLSYTDEMEEPVLSRKELIGNHPGEGSALSFMLWQAWRWGWVAQQRCHLPFWSWAPLILTWHCTWSRGEWGWIILWSSSSGEKPSLEGLNEKTTIKMLKCSFMTG